MSRGSLGTRGASTKRYWLITALVTWLLLMTPMPFTLLGFGWLVYRIRKYMELRRKEASKVTSRLNSKSMNIMLRNGKQLINVEALDEDDKYIKVMDNEGRELLIDKSYIAMLEPIEQDPMD
jgi:sRNA-binding regulator protein Hfq